MSYERSCRMRRLDGRRNRPGIHAQTCRSPNLPLKPGRARHDRRGRRRRTPSWRRAGAILWTQPVRVLALAGPMSEPRHSVAGIAPGRLGSRALADGARCVHGDGFAVGGLVCPVSVVDGAPVMRVMVCPGYACEGDVSQQSCEHNRARDHPAVDAAHPHRRGVVRLRRAPGRSGNLSGGDGGARCERSRWRSRG